MMETCHEVHAFSPSEDRTFYGKRLLQDAGNLFNKDAISVLELMYQTGSTYGSAFLKLFQS